MKSAGMNGQTGILKKLDAASEKWQVELDDGDGTTLNAKPENLTPYLNEGDRVRTRGLKNVGMNGQLGILKSYDPSTGKWLMELADGEGMTLSLLKSNLEDEHANNEAPTVSAGTTSATATATGSPSPDDEKEEVGEPEGEVTFQVGDQVELHSLVNMANMNGKRAVLQFYDETLDRWKVRSTTGLTFAVKAENITKIGPAASGGVGGALKAQPKGMAAPTTTYQANERVKLHGLQAMPQVN